MDETKQDRRRIFYLREEHSSELMLHLPQCALRCNAAAGTERKLRGLMWADCWLQLDGLTLFGYCTLKERPCLSLYQRFVGFSASEQKGEVLH